MFNRIFVIINYILWSSDPVSHQAFTQYYCYYWHDDVIKLIKFSAALLALCAGNSPVIGEFPSQRPVMRSFDVFFDLRENNGDAGDLRRHRAHYDVIVMGKSFLGTSP